MSTLNPRIARLYLTAWLHEEDGVVAFIRDQRIDHRRSEAGSSKHFVNWLDLMQLPHRAMVAIALTGFCLSLGQYI